MISFSSTLFRYISKEFMTNFMALMSIILGIMMIFEVIELFRQAAGDASISLHLIFSLALMKLPYLGERLMPMTVLFAGIYTCWKLNKTSELIAIRSYGVSVWQFLSPILICAFLLGVFSTTVLNPFSSVFLGKHQRLQKKYIEKDENLIAISKTGIWLRQPTKDGYALIHSSSFDNKKWQLNKVLILSFDNDNNFIRRIDSPIAYLKNKYWDIKNPVIEDKIKGLITKDSIKIKTKLTSKKIEESFSDPETIPFWNMAEYIKVMEETGFPATRISLYFHKLLSKPFLFLAMILLAASFSLRPSRFGGTAYMVIFGIGIGFIVFFTESVLHAFAISHKIPVYLAAWSPSIMAMLAGSTFLLHLEDG